MGNPCVIRYTDPASLSPLTARIEGTEGPLVIALDGFCASGKTTLAEFFEIQYGARVIHTDDFYLPREMRSDERYAEPGGTIHYERLMEEVISRLSAPSLSYGVFSHETFSIVKTRVLPFARITVIEGAYASHPFFGEYADLRCFMETDPGSQRERILSRNGAERLKLFEARWIPYERNYEAAFGIREKADFIIRT